MTHVLCTLYEYTLLDLNAYQVYIEILSDNAAYGFPDLTQKLITSWIRITLNRQHFQQMQHPAQISSYVNNNKTVSENTTLWYSIIIADSPALHRLYLDVDGLYEIDFHYEPKLRIMRPESVSPLTHLLWFQSYSGKQ